MGSRAGARRRRGLRDRFGSLGRLGFWDRFGLRGQLGPRVRRWAAGLGHPAGFGGRVLISVTATLVLVLVIFSPPAAARLAARGRPPWPAPGPGQLAAGVHAAGLTLLSAPGVVTRYAVHLDVIVDGNRVTVPAGIGLDYRGRRIAALYTSDTSGIVHIDSDSERSIFTLGQFFDEWQVALTPDRLGGLGEVGGAAQNAGSGARRNAEDDVVAVYADGARVAGPPGSVRLTPHLEITVTYRPSRLPVPAWYAFPAGT
jgi:hypothetical protein